MSIKAIFYEVTNVGGWIKMKYLWRFSIDGREHNVDMEYALISGKRKISLDGRLLHESASLFASAFQYPFTVDGINANVIQQGDNFELRINNLVFSHLYNQERTRQEFVYEDDTYKKPDDLNSIPQKIKPRIFDDLKKPELPKGNEIKQHTEFQEISHFDFANFELHQKGKADFGAWNDGFSGNVAVVNLLDMDDEPQTKPQTKTQGNVNNTQGGTNSFDFNSFSFQQPTQEQPKNNSILPPFNPQNNENQPTLQSNQRNENNGNWFNFENPSNKVGTQLGSNFNNAQGNVTKTPFDMF